MLRIGLTGGIGSGKTTVAHIFEALGIPVYNADDAAKRLMAQDEELKKKIENSFGKESYSNNKLNRKYLAEKVFSDVEKLSLLNSLVHPATIKDAEKWMDAQNAPYLIKEAALIFESGAQKNLDFVIGVKAPLALRMQRTMQRDKISADKVKARIDRQLDEEMKLRLCDYIIVNDEQQLLIPQVLALHEKFSCPGIVE
ncbi:MAG TPA: dephospho-CoA kinase [Hanamia sp.]|nr:dephospho-CoA kinase [Hanamia sp.]